MREIGNQVYKEALRKQIEDQVDEFLSKGGKVQKKEVATVKDIKDQIIERLKKGQHFVEKDYRNNCE